MKSQIIALTLAFLFPTFAFTADKASPEPTKQDRAQMADAHEKMAACLRSNKTMDQCHMEMREQCKQSGMECPMDMKHHRKGHDHETSNSQKK